MADWVTAAATTGTFLIVASAAWKMHRVTVRIATVTDTIRKLINDR